MKKFLSFLVILCLLGCSNAYLEFHAEKKSLQTQKEITDTFTLSQVEDISEVEIFPTPDEDVLEMILATIHSAEKYVYLEMYILSEKRIWKALLESHARWVEVKVILEKNVFQAPFLNKKIFETFQDAGISVSWNNAIPYLLNHTKLLIVDDTVFLSTGNYSHATFTQNREFFLKIWDAEIVKIFLEIFQSDFAGKQKHIAHPNFILSPYSSRTIYETLITSATKSIHMYAYNFSDERIQSLLIEKYRQWVQIFIIMPSIKKVPSNETVISEFETAGIHVVQIEKPAIHAKAILTDATYLWIGSINFSPYSLDENREMGLILSNTDTIQVFLDTFAIDWKK